MAGKWRKVTAVTRGQETSDGAGVRLKRIIGQPELDYLDPFLMLDAFGSDEATDYIAGFPPHPHRGIETVTYMLAGRMRHEDDAGNTGVLGPGSVQWMTAGRGIIHSEMPEQEEGEMRGFQLWVNLPRKSKMCPPPIPEHRARGDSRSDPRGGRHGEADRGKPGRGRGSGTGNRSGPAIHGYPDSRRRRQRPRYRPGS